MDAEFYDRHESQGGDEYAIIVDGDIARFFSIDSVETEGRSTICEAPVETGIKSQDHMVVEPTMVTVTGCITAGSVSNLLTQINELREKGAEFGVVTPDDYYGRLMVKSCKSRNHTDKIDLTDVVLVLQQILFVEGDANPVASNSEDNPAVDGGVSNVE